MIYIYTQHTTYIYTYINNIRYTYIHIYIYKQHTIYIYKHTRVSIREHWHEYMVLTYINTHDIHIQTHTSYLPGGIGINAYYKHTCIGDLRMYVLTHTRHHLYTHIYMLTVEVNSSLLYVHIHTYIQCMFS
jgi:hypothetical protein